MKDIFLTKKAFSSTVGKRLNRTTREIEKETLTFSTQTFNLTGQEISKRLKLTDKVNHTLKDFVASEYENNHEIRYNEVAKTIANVMSLLPEHFLTPCVSRVDKHIISLDINKANGKDYSKKEKCSHRVYLGFDYIAPNQENKGYIYIKKVR